MPGGDRLVITSQTKYKIWVSEYSHLLPADGHWLTGKHSHFKFSVLEEASL